MKRLAAVCAASLLSAPAWAFAPQNCQNTSVGFVPLNDLGAGTHMGAQGGLYPGGANQRPAAHQAAGLAQAAQVVPRDAAGNPDPLGGEIVLLSIGMSNSSNHWARFMPISNADPERNPQLTLVQGAQGGQPANEIVDPNDDYWTFLDDALANAGVTHAQVQVLWMLQAHSGPNDPFPTDAELLRDDLRVIVQLLRDRFPNARLCYLNSRIYAGYATTTLNPEPHAYQQGFSNKWLIQEQIAGAPALEFDPANGPVEAPWLSWGVYSWADGLVPRSDGLTWECSDFQNDGTHPSPQGSTKVANALHAFLKSDPVAQSWYVDAGGPTDPITPYCFGDGSGAPCPCGNFGGPGRGCRNSQVAAGARLAAAGVPSVANDSLVLTAGGMPTPSIVLFFQGLGAPNGGLGVPLGDGLRCAGGQIQRLGTAAVVAGGGNYPGPGQDPISIAGLVPAMGATRYYAAWYRDAGNGFCTPGEFNLSNGVEVSWAP